MTGRWAGSRRRSRLPTGWDALQRRVLVEEPFCRCSGCPRCCTSLGKVQGADCIRPSQSADHIVRGDDHRRQNLRGICGPCHNHKSSQEGNEAKRRHGRFGQPLPPHPGSLTT